MALPVGIKTCEVTFGPFQTYLGVPVKGSVSFVPSRSLIWLATGAPLLPESIKVDLDDDGVGHTYLPYTNQDGFGDGRGSIVKDWTYRAVFTLATTAAQPPNVTFSLPLGPAVVDLDLLAAPVTTVPTQVSLPMIGFLVLNATEPIPPGTPPQTVIVRKS